MTMVFAFMNGVSHTNDIQMNKWIKWIKWPINLWYEHFINIYTHILGYYTQPLVGSKQKHILSKNYSENMEMSVMNIDSSKKSNMSIVCSWKWMKKWCLWYNFIRNLIFMSKYSSENTMAHGFAHHYFGEKIKKNDMNLYSRNKWL